MHSATVNSEEESEREEKKQNLASRGKHVRIRVHAVASVRAAICVAY